MAGEKKAKMYESVAAIALHLALTPKFTVHREVCLPGVAVRTDILVKSKTGHQIVAVLVTHSGSEVDFHKKFARDSAELIQLIAADGGASEVAYVLFDDYVLPALRSIIASTFSATVAVSDFGNRKALFNFCEQELEKLGAPVGHLDKTLTNEDVVALCGKSIKDQLLLKSFGEYLWKIIRSGANKTAFTSVAAAFVQKRKTIPVRKSTKQTRVRRGLGKLLLFNAAERKLVYAGQALVGSYTWLPSLGLGKAVLSVGAKTRWRVTDMEIVGSSADKLIGVTSLLAQEVIEQCLAGARAKTDLYVQRLRNSDYLAAAMEYVVRNYNALATADGMKKALKSVAANSSSSLQDKGLAQSVRWHWLYTYLVALFKAHSKKKQGFGTSVIAKLSGERRFRMQNSILSNLEYESGIFPEELFKPLAHALSTQLKEIKPAEVRKLHQDVVKQQLVNELEDKLVCHGLEHPLRQLIEMSLSAQGRPYMIQRVRLAQAVGAGAEGNAGLTSVVVSGKTLIWWRAAHGRNHVNDKTKELESKILGWRLAFDTKARRYSVSSKFQKAILVIDGDFQRQDLMSLTRAGWDEIFYPDEMDKLAKAIV
jgi:hypothetical protein